MTKEEKAVYEFENILGELGSTVEVTEDLRDACRTVIETLQQQPCEDKYLKEIDHLRKYIIKLETQIVEQETSDDAVSRQYLIEKAVSWKKHFHDSERYVSLTDIQNAPSVTPKPKIGHWISFGAKGEIDGQMIRTFTCSECGAISIFRVTNGNIVNGDLCPNCGAKMQEVKKMTKEEQTDWLCRLRSDLNNGVINTPWNKEFTEALTDILEQESCEDVVLDKHYWKGFNNGIRTEKFRESKRQEPYEDCISRHEVLDVIDRELFKWDVIDEVRKLPPVTPQSKIGHWIHHREKEFVCAEHWECSQCHRTTMTYPFIVHGNDYDAMYYCPKCGAKMVEDTGSEG